MIQCFRSVFVFLRIIFWHEKRTAGAVRESLEIKMKIHRNGVLLSSANDDDETEIVFAFQLYGEKKNWKSLAPAEFFGWLWVRKNTNLLLDSRARFLLSLHKILFQMQMKLSAARRMRGKL